MGGKYYFTPFPYFYVKKIIDEFKPDIINANSPYPNSLSAINIARKKNIPVVGSIHILPENMLPAFTNFLFYETMKNYIWRYLIYFYNQMDWITIPTKTGGDLYIEKGLKKNITPISTGVKTEIFNPNNNGEYLRKKFNLPKKKIVLYTGRINEEKNLEVLINAIPKTLEQVDAHFLICGSGGDYKQDLINLAKKLKVDDHTTFTGFLDWKDYPNIYTIADVFAIPAESELLSLVTLEAIATGLPVVVVNKGALPELASNNNGLVFEPGNSKQMADCIVKILSDDKLRKKMSLKSLELIKKHTVESAGKEYERVYENVLDLHSKR
jgi:glycosyltransferase involved in cell wall biosynthesis